MTLWMKHTLTKHEHRKKSLTRSVQHLRSKRWKICTMHIQTAENNDWLLRPSQEAVQSRQLVCLTVCLSARLGFSTVSSADRSWPHLLHMQKRTVNIREIGGETGGREKQYNENALTGLEWMLLGKMAILKTRQKIIGYFSSKSISWQRLPDSVTNWIRLQ